MSKAPDSMHSDRKIPFYWLETGICPVRASRTDAIDKIRNEKGEKEYEL